MKTEGAPRVITIVVKGGNHFDVHEGEGYADHLCWDEMLGCVAELTHPTLCAGRARYFQTAAERDTRAAAQAAHREERDAFRSRIAAERAALPTVELRALHYYVEQHGERAALLDDELLPIESQPDDIQQAMRQLAPFLSSTT